MCTAQYGNKYVMHEKFIYIVTRWRQKYYKKQKKLKLDDAKSIKKLKKLILNGAKSIY